jgi:holo-[acyl-carrier protein] synthase
MIKGIGIDIIELERIQHVVEKQPRFASKILTLVEQERYTSLPWKRQIEYLAGRFAAKEALGKALGTGIGALFTWQDVSIASSEHGAPMVIWHRNETPYNIHVSISHSRNYIVAQVVLEEKN